MTWSNVRAQACRRDIELLNIGAAGAHNEQDPNSTLAGRRIYSAVRCRAIDQRDALASHQAVCASTKQLNVLVLQAGW